MDIYYIREWIDKFYKNIYRFVFLERLYMFYNLIFYLK